MNDTTIQASANGFLLGMQIAERLNGLSLGSTLNRDDEFIDLMLGLAEGKRALDANCELLQLLPGSADLQTRQSSLRLAMQETASQVIEWYRRQCGHG